MEYLSTEKHSFRESKRFPDTIETLKIFGKLYKTKIFIVSGTWSIVCECQVQPARPTSRIVSNAEPPSKGKQTIWQLFIYLPFNYFNSHNDANTIQRPP